MALPAGALSPGHPPARDQRVGDLVQGRLTRLARVTSELVQADTLKAVWETILTHGAEAVGADQASLTLLSEDRTSLRVVGFRSGRPGVMDAGAAVPVTAPTPAGDAIRTGKRWVVTGRQVIAERYPELRPSESGSRTLVALPLAVASRVVGAIGFSFAEERRFDPAEEEFLDILADACAQALDRVAALEAAATQSARLAFLADAATELASSLDYQLTLSRVAQLAVPTFADWCAIDVVDDGRLRRVAVAHVDPAKVRFAHELAARYPPDPDAANGAWHVMRTGRSELIAEITDELLVAAAVDEEHLAIARSLQLRSAVTVPLIARGRVMGVITWVVAESDRRYRTQDLALAEDLARQAAVALDNADLHSQTLAAAVRLQQAVLPETLPVPSGWDLAHYYSPAGRTDVGGDFYDVIELGDDRLVLYVGDVMGRGVHAAAAMAQMRAAVRAYAALDPTPEVVLTRLDQLFARYPTDQLVTLVYLLVDPARDLLTVANAGHPPPLLLRAAGAPIRLPYAEGPPLGVTAEHRGHATVPFHTGDMVIAYTDGLIERRNESLTLSQQRLHQAVRRLAGRHPAEALREIVSHVPDASRDDDIAVLLARRH